MLLLNLAIGLLVIAFAKLFTFQYASIKPGAFFGNTVEAIEFTFQYASIKPVSSCPSSYVKTKFTFQYASIKPYKA